MGSSEKYTETIGKHFKVNLNHIALYIFWKKKNTHNSIEHELITRSADPILREHVLHSSMATDGLYAFMSLSTEMTS